MRQKLYYAAAVFFAITAVLFMSAADNDITFGIMAIVSLFGMAHYSSLASNLKHLRSNADEDRPE